MILFIRRNFLSENSLSVAYNCYVLAGLCQQIIFDHMN